MPVQRPIVLGAIAWIVLVACACSPAGESVPTLVADASEAAASQSSEPSSTPDPSVVVVRAIHNIFGAGHEEAPDPGEGGSGQVPTAWPLPAGATRIVTFPSVTGQVHGRINQAPPNGPGGEDIIDTDVESYGGISGIIHREKAMFLVGVFLTDAEPADPAPARLDFTDNEDFDLLEPEIGQTFLIGDGDGRRYLAPTDATRLFLGFADAMFYKGLPGFYFNNSGELEVTVHVAIE